MSYDTKAQKSRPELPSGAALSTLVLEPIDDDEKVVDPAAETQPELPDSDD
ncbi:MAG TPA: hypothetical protein VGH28_08165 [Polyangiaceae bacterium]|jgi:hypothetical protein